MNSALLEYLGSTLSENVVDKQFLKLTPESTVVLQPNAVNFLGKSILKKFSFDKTGKGF